MKPTVTQLISLLDKPALLKWANKIGLQGISLDEYSEKSKQAGTNIHNQIENYIKDKIPFESNLHQMQFDKFFFDKEIIEIEKQIETDYFIGRLDIIYKDRGKIYLCDFKSNQKRIYFENLLQLSAYKMAINADKIAIISIPDFKIINIELIDFKPYQEILINLSNIYKIKKDIELFF